MIRLAIFLACLPFSNSIALAAPKPMQTFEGCKLIPFEWADGDSFKIKTAKGDEMTIRLYAVDCLELHPEGDRNGDRLREQRRYFGISDAGKNLKESVEIANSFAKQAADFTAQSLRKPFTLHTRFSSGGGDPRFKRFLGFITLADGSDLGSTLVRRGLARTLGTYSSTPDGKTLKEAKGMLRDLEIHALKNDVGIWARTNWDKLPTERQQLRKEKAEAEITKKLNAPSSDFKINPNVVSKKELMDLEGIGETLADRIIEERKKAPFLKADDLLRVKQLTKPTLEKIRPHLVFTNPN